MDFKGMLKDTRVWVGVLFLVVLAARLIIVFQNPYFNYEAYFDLRQVENIRATGLPLYNDPLSYGGKTHLFAPLYQYLLAASSIVMPLTLAAKVIPNLLAVMLVILVYYISLKITKNSRISLLNAFMSGFIPILFFDMNRISADYLAVLLVFSIIYCMFRINDRKYIDYALILMFLLVLTTPLAFILIIGLLFYLLLLKLENLQIEMKELEMILFFTFLVFWINLLLYKNAFLTHGLLVVWQNTPVQLLSNTFETITFVEAFYTLGIIPLFLGIYAFYVAFYQEKNRQVLLLLGFGISTFLLLWFRLLSLVTGLVFLSVTLIMLSGFSLKKISEFIEKTKIHRSEKLLLAIMLILFAVTAMLPSAIIGVRRTADTPSANDINILLWARNNTPKNATIAATLEEGNIVAYYAGRKDIMDDHFLLTPNIDQRLRELDNVFRTPFETEAVATLNEYNARYIFMSSHAQQKYSISKLAYVSDRDCFDEIYYQGNSSLYLSKCKIR